MNRVERFLRRGQSEEEKRMSKLSAYVLAIAVSLGTTAMLDNNQRSNRPTETAEQRLAADGAFRDGMYTGKLAAEGGRPLRPAIARCPRNRTGSCSRRAITVDTTKHSLASSLRNEGPAKQN